MVCVHKNNTIRKLRMLDEVGHAIVDLVWYDYDVKCKWIARDVPHEKEIIGLYGNNKSGSKFI